MLSQLLLLQIQAQERHRWQFYPPFCLQQVVRRPPFELLFRASEMIYLVCYQWLVIWSPNPVTNKGLKWSALKSQLPVFSLWQREPLCSPTSCGNGAKLRKRKQSQSRLRLQLQQQQQQQQQRNLRPTPKLLQSRLQLLLFLRTSPPPKRARKGRPFHGRR